jgi:hypothetical protein
MRRTEALQGVRIVMVLNRLHRWESAERPTWTDQAALDAQMKTPALQAAGPKRQPILARPFTLQFLSMVSDG